MHRQPSAGHAFVRSRRQLLGSLVAAGSGVVLHRQDHSHNHEHNHGGATGAVHGGSNRAGTDSNRYGIRAVKVGLVGLLVTGALQLVIALLSGSVVLLADAIHKIADAVTAFPMWLAFIIARRPPNRRFTYGYGRAEDLAGVVIVGFIAASAVVAGYESVRQLLDPKPVHQVGWVLLAGLIGFAGNQVIAFYRLRVGRRIGSAALVADGLHARTDGFISLGVVVGALGVMAGYPIADPIVGLFITVAILGVLRSAVTSVGHRILDAVEPALVDDVEAHLRDVQGVLAVRSVHVRWVGHMLRAEADVVVDRDLTVVEGHEIARRAKERLRSEMPGVAGATIQVSPRERV
jgi:cation diffusion facilitator family transporter